MNNKKNGFAITALLYGLSIMALMVVALMMSVMQNSRKNSSTLVRNIEEELNAYGQTAQEYTDGSHDYYIPEGQNGYYKIELQKNKTLVTGTIFLEQGTLLKVDLASTAATIKVDQSGEDDPVIMKAETSGTAFVAGMAKYSVGISIPKKYQFLNGQVITGTADKTRFKATKVADTTPASNDVYDGVKKIEAATATGIVAVTYNPNKPAEPNSVYEVKSSSSSTLDFATTPLSLSEIYITYSDSSANSYIKITKSNGAQIVISPNYTNVLFKAGGYTLSRFGPTNTSDKYYPKDGNYYISMLNKNASGKYEFNQKNTLSTTFYTPGNEGEANTAAGTGIHLIKYGNESYGRPVANLNYIGLNSQKWRFERLQCPHTPKAQRLDDSGNSITVDIYKITEIEEYKPFEVHKDDPSFDSKNPNGPGPILMCGAYTFVDTDGDTIKESFISTDSFTGNINQEWILEPAGLGTYYFRTNHYNINNNNNQNRYLYLDTDPTYGKNRYHVTNDRSKASLFQLTNADL